MHKRVISLGLSVMMGMTALITPAQAASFPILLPYVSDYKMGFTDGSKRVTQPLYDAFSKEKDVLVVTKNGKKGVLHAKTGAEIIPAVWDSIEVPDQKNIAILRKGSSVQYFVFSTKTLSRMTFRQAETFFLSNQHPGVTVFRGDSTMLLDNNGTVLIPPFKGEIRFVDWQNPKDSERDTTRYVVAMTAKGLALHDPNSLKQLFHVPGVKMKEGVFIPVPYLEVVRNGKSGLLKRDGSFVLEPTYTSITLLQNGYVRFGGPQGVGLVKEGSVILQPSYEDVGALNDDGDGYYAVKGDVVTYYSRKSGTSVSLKKGAEHLSGGFLLGRDVTTGMYGVKKLSGEIVVPFVYPALEGPPAAWTLVRKDGKKGLIIQRDNQVKEPELWVDSYVTMGSYSMLAVKDGNKVGLYSQAKGLLLPLQENVVIRYDSTTGATLVTTPDGKTREYREYDQPADISQPGTGDRPDISQPKVSRLTDVLSASHVRGQGFTIINTKTGQPISKRQYQGVYQEGKLVIALDKETADLYTPEGKLLTAECRVAVNGNGEGPPVSLMSYGEAIYALGVKDKTGGRALVKVSKNQLSVLSDFSYSSVSFQKSTNSGMLASLTNTGGSTELWLLSNNEVAAKLVNLDSFVVIEPAGKVFAKQKGTWDIYDEQLKQVTARKYRSLRVISNSTDNSVLYLYQDSKTGLFGLLNHNLLEQTAPKYDFVKSVREVFPQLYLEQKLPASYVFAAGKQFGYLNTNGQEVFRTPLYSKTPKMTHRPLVPGAFAEYDTLMAANATELVDFGKPYRLDSGDAEVQFYANLALYLDLPRESSRQEIIAALTAKGVLPANRQHDVFGHEDFFALAYSMINGKTNQTMTTEQLWKWAADKGFYVEQSPRYSTSPFVNYNAAFINRLLLSKQANTKIKAKLLSFDTLTEEQRKLLISLIKVNGTNYEQLPFPLTKEYADPQLKQIVAEYNRSAAQLLQSYLNKGL